MAADSDRREDAPESVVLGNGETLAERIERLDLEDVPERETSSVDELREEFDL